MSRWAKLHAKVSDSYDFADAHQRDPNAALLFLLALPQADVFGVLPGHPGLLRGKLCALLTLTEAQVEAAFGALCEAGLVRAYADSKGRPMYIIPGYEQHQDVRWDRVGRPEHDLPADWEPPVSMLEAVAAAPRCVLAAWLQERSRTTPGPVPDNSALEVDTDTEVDKDTENGFAPPANADDAAPADGDEGTLPQPASVAQEPPAEGTATPTSSLKRKRRTDAELAADTQAIRDKLPETLLPTLDLWLDNLASHNTTGALTAGRALSETQGFADLVLVHGLTEGAIRHGVNQALTREDRRDGKPGVTSVAFVLEVARGFKAGSNGTVSRLPFNAVHTQAPSRPDTFVGGKVKL